MADTTNDCPVTSRALDMIEDGIAVLSTVNVRTAERIRQYLRGIINNDPDAETSET